MEERDGDERFFFATAYARINSLFAATRNLFPGLSENGKKSHSTSFGKSLGEYIQRNEKKRFEELLWIADGDASRINEIKRLTIIEYFAIKEIKVKEMREIERQNKKRNAIASKR